MVASIQNPLYTAFLVVNEEKYDLSPAMTSLELSQQEGQMAQSVAITLVDIRVDADRTLSQLLQVRQRIFVYANDGERNDEVFRGWIWTKYLDQNTEQTAIQIKCYDNMIYFQESQDSLYFGKGKKSSAIVQEICDSWGIKLAYQYDEITHDKLVLRGTLSDIIKSDILEKIKTQTGNRFVIRYSKDVLHITREGTNSEVFTVFDGVSAMLNRYETSMDNMITQVRILGNAGKSGGQQPVVATVEGDTKTYGTLRKIANKDKEQSLEAAKKEAQNTIAEYGKPSVKFQIGATDIPWINLGDKVHVRVGKIAEQDLIVTGIDRDISNKEKKMTLTCIKPKEETKT